MSKLLQNQEIFNSFTCELEKKAINIGNIVSKINPFRLFKSKKYVPYAKAMKISKKPGRLARAGKEFATIPVVAGGVTLAGGAYGAVTLPPRI